MVKISQEFKLKAIKTWFRFGGAVTPRLVARVAYGVFFTRPFRHKPLPSDVELISQAHIAEINFENRRLRGYVWGDGERVVLLAHGWSSHALTMRRFIQALTKQGFKVIAFDAPAHGNSEGVRTNGMQYRRFLHKLVLQYQPYAIIAHSLGGICTLSELPQIKDFKVAKVITLAMPVTSTIMVQRFLEQATLHHLAYSHFERYVERRMGIDHNNFDLQQIYPDGISYNGLIVHDTRDSVIPYTEGAKLSQLWPSATMLTTHGLDHSGILKDNQVVEQIVQFILT